MELGGLQWVVIRIGREKGMADVEKEREAKNGDEVSFTHRRGRRTA